MRQSWRELLFLHARVDPALLRPHLPPGLTVDTYEGAAYLGVVPFTMCGVRPVWSPPVPGLSDFHECNVRTYVHRNGREPGVWFFSLDAANPIAVALARGLWKLPYFWAEMSLRREGDRVRYETRRRSGGAALSVAYTVEGTPAPAEPGTLEHFLAERYLLYAGDDRRLHAGRVWHTPYPLQRARVDALSQSLTDAAGVSVDAFPLAHYAVGVDVDVFALRDAPCTPGVS